MAAAAALGVALAAVPPEAQESGASPSRTSISGVAFDSIALRPMAGALVQLVAVMPGGKIGDTHSARTDTLGRWHFETVAFGTYLLGLQHVTLDTLGFRPPIQRVDVRQAAPLRITLATPSMASIVRATCGTESTRDSLALLVGSVRDARADTAIARAYVVLRWSEIFLSRAGVTRSAPTHDLHTNEEGWYAACVPSSTPVQAHAEVDTMRSGEIDVVLTTSGVLRRDLYVGPAERMIAGRDSVRRSGVVDAGERILVSGRVAIRGVVRRIDGRPLAGARVRLADGRTEARTDDDGRFVLRDLPHGTYTIEARALGYVPAQASVDLVEFRENDVELTLDDVRTLMLDTLQVVARRRLEQELRAGFERRRRSGVGLFFDEARIDSLRPVHFSDLLSGVPGIRFMGGRREGEFFETHAELGISRGSPCAPSIFLDGQLLLPGLTDLDQFIDARMVRRMEVYHRGSNLPAEFAAGRNCGVLAIWTGGSARPTARSTDSTRVRRP